MLAESSHFLYWTLVIVELTQVRFWKTSMTSVVVVMVLLLV